MSGAASGLGLSVHACMGRYVEISEFLPTIHTISINTSGIRLKPPLHVETFS